MSSAQTFDETSSVFDDPEGVTGLSEQWVYRVQDAAQNNDKDVISLYIPHSVHYLQQIHDTKPTKCTDLFLRYLYHNITLDIRTCFGLQWTIIRESNQNNAA